MDILQRGARLFDRLIVAILRNEAKQPLFSVAERVAMLRESTADLCNVEIDSFTGLLADYAKAKHATVLLRGIRAVSDYEYEAAMSLMNRRLAPEIETVCLIASDAILVHQFAPGERGGRARRQHFGVSAVACGSAC